MTGARLARIERGPRPLRRGPPMTAADAALVLGLWAASQAAILAIAATVGAFSAPPEGAAAALMRWDARWYVEIATTGYHREPAAWESGDGANWPFFPGFALLAAAVARAGGLAGAEAGMVAAGALRLVGLAAMFLYARDLFGRRFARGAAALWAVWPLAVHQAAPMSEALFAPLLTLTLWLARREAWLGAGPAAAALSASRAVGAFVAFPMLLIAARRLGPWRVLTAQPGTERAVVALACCGVGIGAFILYLDALTGDGLAFQRAQAAWGREPKWPWMTVWDALNPLTAPPGSLGYNLFNLAATAAGLWLARELLRLRLGAEALYVAIVALLGLAAGQTTSLPRFMGALAPLAIPVAWRMARRPRARGPILAASAAAMAAATALWCAESLWLM